jgi:glycosyltransferase involved in cell wall biosynthesis
MAREARRRVEENFSWEAIARKTAELYRTVCGGAP